MSADSVVGIGWDVLKRYVVVPIERGFGYVISSKRFANRLRGEVQNLENEVLRVEVLAEQARNNVRKFHVVFTTWKESADKALEESPKLLDDFKKATKTCCYGTLPDPKSRYRFSRKAEGKIEAIKELTQKCGEFKELNDISFIDPAFTSSASTSIKIGDDGVFESRASMIRNIMGALAENTNSVVGVYGMGGIGKSTLLVDVERKVRDEKSFHSVAKADVSENPDIKTIQGEIADALGLTEIKDKETISGRAKLLHDRLKDEEREKKKVLIILDNLWDGLDLKKVGIPCRHDNKVMGCKLLLTSRHRDVLRRNMGCDKDFSLGRLKDEEAKRLFEKIVGDKVHDDELKSWVNVALDKCAGVPFLIVAMAKRFKDAELYEWRNTLENFEEFKDKETSDLINHMLQRSYDKLEENVKSLLRLCVVYNISKPSLENLVRYGFGLGLFGEVSSMEVARDRLCLQIRTLQASSLLLDSEDVDGFKIHDLVREFVASIASKDHPILVLKDKDKLITELPKDKLRRCRAVCFPYVDMQELPQELDCSELQIFLLFTNKRSLKVPYSLFHSMRKLTVLNLTRICLTCSSSSPFQILENLHTLCLEGCSLDNVAILGELKGLHILSFVNSNIYRLPREIGQLTELKLLDLNHCRKLEIIEPGVLQSLIKLEELYMQNSFAQWNTIEQTPPTNASLMELNHMKNLRTLHVSIPNMSMLPEDLNVEKLTKYEIKIGNAWGWSNKWLNKFKGSRTLELKSNPLGNILRKGCIQSILGKTDNLSLEQLDRSEQSICVLSQKGFPKLKHLQVKNSLSTHYILQSPSHVHFKMLELLILQNLINLEMICESHISSRSFSTLKVVKVKSCDKMEVLFPLSVMRGLPLLEEIKVVSCKLMRTIIEVDDCHKFELHNLHVLKLRDLPNIKNFFNVGSTLSGSTSYDQVSTQIAFFNGQQVAFPSLETLDIEDMDIEKIWDNQVAEDSFHNLKSLHVDGCNKLVNLVPSCILGRLLSLEVLEASDCGALEVVFELQPLNHLDRDPIALPLKELTVSELPKLKCVWDKELHCQVKFQGLRSISISRCKSLASLFPTSVAKDLMQLEELKINECGIVEIIEKEDGLVPRFVFPKLTSLELKYLRELKCLYIGTHTSHWPALKSLKVHGCDKVEILASHLENEMPVDKYPLFLIEKVAFPSLEALNIASLDNIEMIWDNQVAANSFHNLKSLYVDRCNKLVNLVPSCILGRLLSLEVLEASNCGALEVVFELQPRNHLDRDPIALPLKELTVSELPKLKCVWDKELHCQVKFQGLRSISISRCKSLASLFPTSVAKDLMQLEELKINECGIAEIIEKEDGLVPRFVFPKLTSLELKYLRELKCLYIGTHTSHWPALKSLKVHGCDKVEILASHLENEMPVDKYPLFLIEKVAFPSLEALNIASLDNIEMIWDNQVAANSFHNLKSLYVDRCNKLVNLVPSCILGRLLSLEVLEASNCGALEVVFELQPRNHLDRDPIALPLKELTVSELPKLKCVWDKELHCQVKFQGLRSISISRCKSLASLFPTSVAKDLMQLEELKINECGIAEIIEKEDGLVPRFVFPKLTSLELKYLRELKCLYIGTHTSHWPALKSLKVHGCDKVEILASHLENEMPVDKYPLFLIEKVAFPSLEALNIASLDNIEMIWDNQVAANSFHNLKSLYVDRCNKLVNLVPSCILGRLLSLEVLEASDCGALEVVFELQPPNHLDRNPIALPLKELTVSELPKLKCVWDKELHCQVKFQSLRSISVSRCESLASLFPTSVAKDLMQLEELKIDECGIVEIIEKEDGLVPRFVFPKLTSLKLKYLRELKCLYIGTHTCHWPALKSLKVHGCDKVEILASHLQNEMPLDKHALFLIEKGAFPNLQELKLDLSEQMEIWHGHFHDGEFFCKLSLLKLRHLSQESSISTCRFVESLTNLEELVVCESYLEDPSSNEEAIEGTSHEMKVILPFSRYIRHLQTLDVSHCDELSKMFTPTIAENLVALTKLRISNCRILTAVINDEKGGDGRVVAFNQLKYMELDGLIGLRSFSSGGYTLMFPLLEDIIVTRCPNMKFFSQGPTEASKLKRVRVSKEVWFWAGNLNITIQNMFEEMGTLAGANKMLLSDFPGLIGKWHKELNPIKSYWQLISMVVDKCPSFINAIPSRLMLVLDNLGSLQVCDCELLEEIFDLGGLEVVESTRILPQLWQLNLANLPKLRRLWNRDLQESICFDSLTTLILYNCGNLGHAFASSMARCLANLEEMEIKECGQMEEVIIEEEGQGSTVEKITFLNLRQMKLECLPHLTCFLSRKNHMLECPKLEMMIIAHCPKMESLIGQSRMEDDHSTPSFFTSQVQFPKLWSMDLSHMDNLSKIWTNTPQETLTFDCLWKVEVRNCKGLENLFPYWVATSLTHLKKLQVESCEIEEIVTNGGDTPCSNTTQDLFPELTSLVLHDMPQLKSFYPNLPTLHWPLLKELRVTHCDKLNMLSFTASMNSWAQKYDQQDLSNQEAHSSFERDFPNFERLLLVNNNIHMIQDGNFPDDIFSKPIALTLACFHDENAIFPSIFLLERFRNLQSLEVFCSSFEDIFANEGLVEEGKHPELESLREIKLNKLRNLKRVWREDSLVSKILQSIEAFEIWDCPCLTTIFPTVASFQNLTKLVVKNSSGLVHLVTVSTVTNLMHLKRMTIIGCERMKEVVANDGNGEGKVISFGNLHFLVLQDLPSLECFSSISSCTFRFPSLRSIKVEECPKMKIFSKGTLRTPQLCLPIGRVRLFRYQWDHWTGKWEEGDDLNTTIRKLSA